MRRRDPVPDGGWKIAPHHRHRIEFVQQDQRACSRHLEPYLRLPYIELDGEKEDANNLVEVNGGYKAKLE